jgi:hypothetical protein
MRTAVASPVTYRNAKLHLGAAGSDEYARYMVLERDVRHLRQAMDAVLNERSGELTMDRAGTPAR